MFGMARRPAVLVAFATTVAVALLGSAAARGGPDDDAPAAVEIANATWALTLKAPGLREARGVGGVRQLLHGACRSCVEVEVLIDEPSVAPKDGAAWLGERTETWSTEAGVTLRDEDDDAERVAKDAAPRVLFERPGVGVDAARRLHGYTAAIRGVHVFVVHAAVAVGDGDAAAITAVLRGLRLGADPGLTLAAYETAMRSGRDPADPYLSYQAGMRYARSDPPRHDLVIRSLEAAFEHATPEAFDAGTRAIAEQTLGYAHLALDHFDAALRAFDRRRDLARTARTPDEFIATYDIACVHARAGRPDAAFAELEQVIASPQWRGLRDHAQRDTDLTSLRNLPRWETSGAAAELPEK
jgi:hypothetical protein